MLKLTELLGANPTSCACAQLHNRNAAPPSSNKRLYAMEWCYVGSAPSLREIYESS